MSTVSRRLLAIYALLAAVVLACGPTSLSLASQWLDFDDPTYTHGFALAAVFVWLVFRARDALAVPAARPAPLVYLGLLICAIAWLVFWRASLQTLHELLLPILMGLAVWAALGWQVARRLTIPLALLYLAIPMWEVLTPLLQWTTVQAVDAMLGIAGVKVHTQGTLIYVPEGVFEVVGACSGLNFLVAGLALATMLGEIHRDSMRIRVALWASMAGLAMVSNWLRVFVIVYAGHLTHMQHPLVTSSHYTVGWVIFTVAAIGFFWVASRLPASPEPAAGPPSGADPAFRPIALAGVVLLLAVIPVAIASAHRGSGAPQQEIAVTLPSAKRGWVGPVPVHNSSWLPVFAGAHGRSQALYRDAAGAQIEAFAVVYLSQRQGAELVGYYNSLSGAKLFLTRAPSTVQASGGEFLETSVVDAQGERSLIWSVYTVGSRRFAAPLLSQLAYGLGAYSGPLRSGLIALRVRCSTTCEGGREELGRFVNQMGPEFKRVRAGSASLLFFRGDPS